ncbi:MAG: fatty acid desaturase [Marinovum sp.]|nr:fatty acid desaturase [Marinovum sp.]
MAQNARSKGARAFEWPTFALILATYGLWGATLFWPLWLAIPAVAVLAALHASLSHEALHGHPSRNAMFNAGLVFPVLSLLVPYLRFKDTHMAHHQDSRLTDPYEDPESNYLDPAIWAKMSAWKKAAFDAHNTLAGRMILGPILGQTRFMAADCREIVGGDRRVLAGWLLHIPAVALVLGIVWAAPMPLWAYFVAAFFSNALLRIRTFLEHQAHRRVRGRTVIIEDRGPLAFLFLNNNLHVVHHMHPRVPWYKLPEVYRGNRDRYLRQNEGYLFSSYAQIFGRYFLRSKDSVAHPLYED